MCFSDEDRNVRTVLAAVDAVLTVLAFEAAYAGRGWLHWRFLHQVFFLTRSDHILMVSFWVAAWLCTGFSMRIYNRSSFGRPTKTVREIVPQAVYAAFALVLFEYSLRLEVSRPFLAAIAIFSSILVLTSRLLSSWWIRLFLKDYDAVRSLLIAGTGPAALRAAAAIESTFQGCVSICGLVAVTPTEQENASAFPYPVIPAARLSEVLREQVIDEIVFVAEGELAPGFQKAFRLCDEHGVRRRIALDFLPYEKCDVRLERLGDTPLLTFDIAPDDAFRMLVKRLSDVAIAAIGLILASPVLLAAAVAIRVSSPGPIIFRQQRCGLNGRRFVCYKFRSMVVDAEERKHQVIHLSCRQTATKIPNDPRLTPVGRWLRRCSIDELPQLFNVLRGEMSLVGPRPAIPSEVAVYENWQRRRLRMRPGLTCLWAINGRDQVDFESWMKMDLQYIENWSLGLDWAIILRTIPAVLLGKGAS